MRSFLLFCFFFLFGCISAEKNSYDSLINNQNNPLERKDSSSREIAHLKNTSQLEESSFQFINKQMKGVIKKYRKMKRQLTIIESKLDELLKRQKILANSFLTSQKPAEGDFKEEELSLKDENTKDTENEIISEEESSLLQEEITDDTNIFQEEETKENSELKNQEKALIKRETKTEEEKPSSLIKAKNLFMEESYENAISQFQKYRDQNPKGNYYPEATFYIGQSFKHLKMPIEAEVFFKEVVESYPQSLWASRAKKLLEE